MSNTKTFDGDFDIFKEKLQNRENFSFIRFSDGELYILQNKRLELKENHYIIDNVAGPGWYNSEEQKEFIPGKHDFYRRKLEESLRYNKPNFYRGICTKPDVNQSTFNYMINLSGGDETWLTWANLFINGNYPRYVEEIVPLFKDREIIMIVNESADLSGLPFPVKKDFRVGTNCFINNYGLIEELKKYIDDNGIENHLFLISAASLTNLIGHQLHMHNPNNSYIDIGSTLNPLMKMEGWKGSRTYLLEYWEGHPANYTKMKCQW
jgi:hypothetical protein